MIKFVLVWCRLLLPKPTIYPTLSHVSKWILSNLQPAENYLARGIWWCWKSSRAHACLQGFHFINIFSVRFAQYNRLQNSDFLVLWNLYSVSYWGISKVTLFKKKWACNNFPVSNDSFITKGQRSGSHYLFIPFISFK